MDAPNRKGKCSFSLTGASLRARQARDFEVLTGRGRRVLEVRDTARRESRAVDRSLGVVFLEVMEEATGEKSWCCPCPGACREHLPTA